MFEYFEMNSIINISLSDNNTEYVFILYSIYVLYFIVGFCIIFRWSIIAIVKKKWIQHNGNNIRYRLVVVNNSGSIDVVLMDALSYNYFELNKVIYLYSYKIVCIIFKC